MMMEEVAIIRVAAAIILSLQEIACLDMRHIQYQGETLPPFPLVLAFHLVLGKFHICACCWFLQH